MQIIDANDSWVRVVVLTLRRRESPMTFVLFPMVHIGSPEFYETVRTEAGRCDVVVLEGVGKSVPTSLLTLSYRTMRFNTRSGLVVQNIRAESFDVPVVRPDMGGADFRRGWRRLPWLQRLLVWALVPVVAVQTMVLGNRALLSGTVTVEDDPTLEELDAELSMPELFALIGDDRDRLLVQALAELHDSRCHEPVTVAVVYGAKHVPAVVTALSGRYGYVVREGRFVTVFDS